jgi:2-haloacid dehalogenase
LRWQNCRKPAITLAAVTKTATRSKTFLSAHEREAEMITAGRRTFLETAASLVGSGVLYTSVTLPERSVAALATAGSAQDGVKALFFDVFGTLVDWRTGVAREAESILKPRGYRIDWPAFADAWRAEYAPGLAEVSSGRIRFARLDVLHRRMLGRILPRFGLQKLPEDALHQLNLAWHRLDAWPDVAPGFTRLGGKYLLAPVSNGNISLIADLARRNHLRFDAILGAEIAGDYKPKPRVYLASAEAFDLSPAECMMVSAAAHPTDIEGAHAAGLRTASVARPDEFGQGKAESIPKVPVDITTKTLLDLADQLGA